MVRLTHDGLLQFLGRIDGQVKIRGFRVELSEIEAVLMEYAGVRSATVNVVSNGGLPEVAAYIIVDRRQGAIDRAADRRDAAQPSARIHGAEIPGRGGQSADAHQRQGGPQAVAGSDQSAEGRRSAIRRSLGDLEEAVVQV